ncbi:MAG: amidohydrolase family protein [Xanthobacteraceae bacterium]
MNVHAPAPARDHNTKLGLIDVDIHPRPKSPADLKPYMSPQWWDHLQMFGSRRRHGYVKGHPYPKAHPADGQRLDAWTPDGGMPGSDLDFMRKQHLDVYGVDFGIMNPLGLSGQGDQSRGLSAALSSATNDWQLEAWNKPEPRLKASIVVPYEDAEASVLEIKKHAGDKRFAHVMLLSRTAEALGRPRYWPIYQAAVEAGLPIGIHVFGYSGWTATPTGFPSFYVEEMTEHSASTSSLVTSMIMEGVFERFPTLKIVLIEAGFAWLPSLGWRMDRNWKRLKAEVPHLKLAPSEYMRKHFWVSTQPMEEPEHPADLVDIMGWIGWDRILFASDYPHWDYDDPVIALPANLGAERRKMIQSGNAQVLYNFG